MSGIELLSAAAGLLDGDMVKLPNGIEEYWKRIECEGYVPNLTNPGSITYVSTLGRVMRNSTDIVGPEHYRPNAAGYVTVSISRPFVSCSVGVHVLVCRTFRGDPPSPYHNTVDHINGVRDDNRLENLRWATWDEQLRNRSYKKGPDGERILCKTPRCPVIAHTRRPKPSVYANQRAFYDYINVPDATVESLSEQYRTEPGRSSLKDQSVRGYISGWFLDLKRTGQLTQDLVETFLHKLCVTPDEVKQVKTCVETTKELKAVLDRKLSPDESAEFNQYLHTKVQEISPACTDPALLLSVAGTIYFTVQCK